MRLPLLTAPALVAAAVLALTPAAGSGVPLVPGCANQLLERPFLPWLDPAYYVLTPDGGVEARARGWVLAGGASVVTGNEPFRVRRAFDRLSLRLPPGSRATTPPSCVSLLHPTLRFFARGGALTSPLLVEAVFRDALGAWHRLQVGAVPPAPAWAPTLPLAVLANATALPLLGDAVSVSFTFRPAGDTGWWVDDVYVDPYKGR